MKKINEYVIKVGQFIDRGEMYKLTFQLTLMLILGLVFFFIETDLIQSLLNAILLVLLTEYVTKNFLTYYNKIKFNKM